MCVHFCVSTSLVDMTVDLAHVSYKVKVCCLRLLQGTGYFRIILCEYLNSGLYAHNTGSCRIIVLEIRES